VIKSGVTVKLDVSAQVLKSLRAFGKERVLVGVPEANAGREDYAGQPINNATIGYLMENGSPAANIPARPHLVPGVLDAKDAIVSRYQGAARLAVNGDVTALSVAHHVVGQIAADSVRLKITSGLSPPLAPSTIANRARQRGTKKRASEIEYARLLKEGATPGQAQAGAGIQALVNSGQYVSSITFVVRPRGK
jgi:hypothetical protein